MKANHKIATLKRRVQEVQELLFIIAWSLHAAQIMNLKFWSFEIQLSSSLPKVICTISLAHTSPNYLTSSTTSRLQHQVYWNCTTKHINKQCFEEMIWCLSLVGAAASLMDLILPLICTNDQSPTETNKQTLLIHKLNTLHIKEEEEEDDDEEEDSWVLHNTLMLHQKLCYNLCKFALDPLAANQ